MRCVKPNAAQVAAQYDASLVLHQLRCCGVLEVTRIARAGYPTRYLHQEFADRYGILLTPKARGQLVQHSQPTAHGTESPACMLSHRCCYLSLQHVLVQGLHCIMHTNSIALSCACAGVCSCRKSKRRCSGHVQSPAGGVQGSNWNVSDGQDPDLFQSRGSGSPRRHMGPHSKVVSTLTCTKAAKTFGHVLSQMQLLFNRYA